MRIPFLASLLFTLMVCVGCDVNPCDYDCNSGPVTVFLELLDKETGENLFTNGTYQVDNLEVWDLEDDNRSVSYVWISEDEVNRLMLGPFGFEVKEAHYAIVVREEIVFTLSLLTEETIETCCTTYSIQELSITGAEFILNETTGVYEVLIEL